MYRALASLPSLYRAGALDTSLTGPKPPPLPVLSRAPALWLIHTARNRDRDWETMGFYIMLCTVHTTQGQGQGQGAIVFYCTHPSPCPCTGPVQCV